MKISKSMLAAGLVTTVAAGSLAAVGAVSAHDSNSQSDLVDRLATTLNVDSAQVQAVFDAEHADREAEREVAKAEKLQELVDAGTITADQKTALEAKFAEIHTQKEELKDQDLTREEMRAKMQAFRDDLKAWADEQGIDLSVIRPEGGAKGKHGHGSRGGFGGHNEAIETSTDQP